MPVFRHSFLVILLTSVKSAECLYQIADIRRPRRLKGRVHRQLRKTDINRIDRYLGGRNIAECASARNIRTVGICLI